MSDTEDIKQILVKTLGGIDALIQRESHSDRLTKMATDAANKLEALEGQIKVAEGKLNALNIEKDALMSKANKEASEAMEIVAKIQKETEERLANAKRIEQQTKEKLEEAKTAYVSHQNALNDVLSQKEKLRAALAG